MLCVVVPIQGSLAHRLSQSKSHNVRGIFLLLKAFFLYPLFISVCFCPFQSVSVFFVSLCPFLSVSVHFGQFLSASLRFCLFLFISVVFCLFLSVFVRFCQRLNVSCMPHLTGQTGVYDTNTISPEGFFSSYAHQESQTV